VNIPEIAFGNLPRHKLNNELAGEWLVVWTNHWIIETDFLLISAIRLLQTELTIICMAGFEPRTASLSKPRYCPHGH
jgi:hypothetical protein